MKEIQKKIKSYYLILIKNVYTEVMTKSKVQKTTKNKSKNVLIKFFKQTKEGKFASVENANLKYSRLNEKIGNVDSTEDIYYYSLS